jgi:REP element-mobilizing transposase RayT
MSRPIRLQYAGALYHVTARGNERRAIDRSDKDRECFIEILGKVTLECGWIVHAYVLMPNHYHLSVETPSLPQPDPDLILTLTYEHFFPPGSKQSRCMTLVHAAEKSRTNFSRASSAA